MTVFHILSRSVAKCFNIRVGRHSLHESFSPHGRYLSYCFIISLGTMNIIYSSFILSQFWHITTAAWRDVVRGLTAQLSSQDGYYSLCLMAVCFPLQVSRTIRQGETTRTLQRRMDSQISRLHSAHVITNSLFKFHLLAAFLPLGVFSVILVLDSSSEWDMISLTHRNRESGARTNTGTSRTFALWSPADFQSKGRHLELFRDINSC